MRLLVVRGDQGARVSDFIETRFDMIRESTPPRGTDSNGNESIEAVERRVFQIDGRPFLDNSPGGFNEIFQLFCSTPSAL